jgi:hypothetical protein
MTVEQRKAYRRDQAEERRLERIKLRVQRRLQSRQITHDEAENMKTVIFADRQDDVTIEFTDVSVEMFNGATRVFSPLSDYQKLTYPISTTYPGDNRFFGNAEETAAKLLPGVQELPAS